MCVLYVCLGLSCLAMFLIADYVRYIRERKQTHVYHYQVRYVGKFVFALSRSAQLCTPPATVCEEPCMA